LLKTDGELTGVAQSQRKRDSWKKTKIGEKNERRKRVGKEDKIL